MQKKVISNLKLGIFVLAGLFFLVLILYMIGKDKNFFGSTYVLKARFENSQGLVPGNNVRFSGIQVGTVKKVTILTDTIIEVTMIIDTKMQTIIRKNALVSIGTDGLVGNKLVNIIPGRQPSSLAIEGDILVVKKGVNTDDIMQSLNKSTNDVAEIAAELKVTITRINNSQGLWLMLNDESISASVKKAITNIRMATGTALVMANSLNTVIMDVKNGKGSVGILLRDTAIAQNLNDAILKIKQLENEANSLAMEIDTIVTDIHYDINSGKGTLNALLKDTIMVNKLNASLDNIEKGTENFNMNMEALKHNFLLKGYIKKQEKKMQKDTLNNK